MILEALVKYYDTMAAKDKIAAPGWQSVRVSYALDISIEGELKRLVTLKEKQTQGKKEVIAPQNMRLPAQVKRAVGIVSNFLCENSTYMLAIDSKGKPERSKMCFEACANLHKDILADADHPAAGAILAFFEKWDPDLAAENEIIAPYLDELYSGANIIFMINEEYAHNIPEIKAAWNRHYQSAEGDIMQCLVTGDFAPAARLHPSIKGVAGAQSSGASLVSFNAPAFDSYGRDGGQGYNAPVSNRAAFAYASALNHMLAGISNKMRLGDTTVVFWAEDAEPAYDTVFGAMLGGDNQTVEDEDIKDIMKKLSMGQNASWGDFPLYPDNRFYVLGIAPNAARLSIRFFFQDSFGAMAGNIQKHHEQMEIIRPSYDERPSLSVWQLLSETVNPNSRDKKASPQLEGDLLRAILTGGRYPATLLNSTEIRIRAEQKVTRGRAGIIKAYLLRNIDKKEYKEVLSVELNDQTIYQPYLLGRLFALLEGLQQAANPGINATIKDRYFNSACGTPAIVFPQLIKLSGNHTKKLGGGLAVNYSKEIGAIMAMMTASFPKQLSLEDQGIFQIGYYHQTQKRFEKKEDK